MKNVFGFVHLFREQLHVVFNYLAEASPSVDLSNDGLTAASFMTFAVTAHHQNVNDNVIECFAAISIGFIIISVFHVNINFELFDQY